jgi:hypothetical protein
VSAARTDEGPRLETEGQEINQLNSILAPRDVERYLRFRRHWELKRLRQLPMHYGTVCYCERWWST